MFSFRLGGPDNVLIFTKENQYNPGLMKSMNSTTFELSHKATGADLFRFSTNFGLSWSNWLPYSESFTFSAEKFRTPSSFGRMSVTSQVK